MAGSVLGGRPTGSMQVVCKTGPGHLGEAAGEGLEPVQENGSASQVLLQGGVCKREQ